MHAERSLPALESRLQARLSRLKLLMQTCGVAHGSNYAAETGRKYSYIVIESMNCWVLFSRNFLISAALGAYTRNNGRVTSNFNRQSTLQDVIIDAAIFENPRLASSGRPTRIHPRQEPTWHDPAVITRLSTALGLSNSVTVSQALSLNATFMRDLPPIRNYFAHKNEDTAERVRQIGRQHGISGYAGTSSRKKTPIAVIASPALGRPQSILKDWIDEMATTASLMVE